MSASVFPCPKCGAWPNVEHLPRATETELRFAQQRLSTCQGYYADESLGQVSKPIYTEALYRAEDHLRDVQYRLEGPWLHLNCSRCRFMWRERPLDTRSEGTPIYDSLTGGSTETADKQSDDPAQAGEQP